MSRFILTLIVVLAAQLRISHAFAEFVRLNPYTFVSTSGQSAVIVVPPGVSRSGILVMELSPPMLPQQFNPATATGNAIFLETNQSGVPTKFLVGSKSYTTQGSFSVQFQQTRLAVDLGLQPYITIIDQPELEKTLPPSLLGLVGIDPVVLLEGEQGVALFEANQLLGKERKKKIQSYNITAEGSLTFNGEPLAVERVGIVTEQPSHPCAAANSAIKFRTEQRMIEDFMVLAASPTGLSATELRTEALGMIVRNAQICEFKELSPSH
jgi:hypothetical protein